MTRGKLEGDEDHPFTLREIRQEVASQKGLENIRENAKRGHP